LHEVKTQVEKETRLQRSNT